MLSDISKTVLSDKFLSFTETLQLSTVSKTRLIRSGYSQKILAWNQDPYTSIPKDYPSEGIAMGKARPAVLVKGRRLALDTHGFRSCL
jgi:hypothetical protein